MPERGSRFNVISENGDGSGFAIRLVSEGHDVRMWIRDRDSKSICDNMVPKVGDFEDLINDADRDSDIFIFDTTGNGAIADYLALRSFPVLGDSVIADRLERDRSFGYGVMADCGIEVPTVKSFDDFDAAISFVEKNPDRRFVYKPSKHLGELSSSHVSYDADDLVQMLHNIRDEVDIADPEFELQEFTDGVAISTELWFNHGDAVEPLTNHTLERKELMNGDIGPSGGCVGNLTWFCDGCKACDVAKQLVPWARQASYHGMLDLNAIVAGKRVYGLEFTPRFGYDAAPTLLFELVRGGLGTFLEDAARGQISRLNLREGFAGGVRVTIPLFPSEKYKADENIPIRGIEDENDFYFYNVKKDSEGNLVTSGAWGIVALALSHSISPHGAMERPLDALRALKLKGKQYRTDLAKVFVKDLEKLDAFGVRIMSEAHASAA